MGSVVHVVSADEDAQRLLEERLRASGLEVSASDGGAGALALIETERPDLVLIDDGLPDISAPELLRQLRRSHSAADVPVILVSEKDDEIDRVIAFELGADDFVARPFSARELTLRVEAVLRRRPRGEPENGSRVAAGEISIDTLRHEVTVSGRPVGFTALEFRLLLDLARNRGRVLKREELLERVWRYPGQLELRTVDSNVKRLRRKLGPAGKQIETVRGVGYRMRP